MRDSLQVVFGHLSDFEYPHKISVNFLFLGLSTIVLVCLRFSAVSAHETIFEFPDYYDLMFIDGFFTIYFGFATIIFNNVYMTDNC